MALGRQKGPQPELLVWTCPALTDSLDRLNGLRGVDGGEQQTAPVVSGGVQARGGGRGPRPPFGLGGGGRAWPAGPAGTDLAALGGGPHGGRERRAAQRLLRLVQPAGECAGGRGPRG